MSLPRLLYSESYREPLLPSGTSSCRGGGGDPPSRRRGNSDADITSDIQLEIDSQSFATEPFHQFDNAGIEADWRAAASPHLPAGGAAGGSPEGRLTGGVDENSEHERVQPEISHASGSSAGSAVNYGKARILAHRRNSVMVLYAQMSYDNSILLSRLPCRPLQSNAS